MITGMAMACLVTGLIAGWLLRSVFIKAEISRMRDRMQHEVNHWRRKAERAQSISDQLARQLAAHIGHLPDHQDWQQEDGH